MLPISLRGQSLTLALVAAVALSLAAPGLGASGGPLAPEVTTKIAVFLIFLMQGLSLPTRQLARCALNVRLHGFCLAGNFVLAPLVMLAIVAGLGGWLAPEVRPGLIYLAVLPTTISSAVVMTANSEGDTAGALFATTLSNIAGIVLTPLLCLWLLDSPGLRMPPLSPLFAKLALLVALPLGLGQAVRPLALSWLAHAGPWFKRSSNALVVFIVFAAFCDSARSELWSSVSGAVLASALVGSVGFLALLSLAVWFGSPLAGADPRSRIAAFFCASQKTLATGVPMAALVFAGQGQTLGLMLLPLMIHHPLQLVLAGILAPRFAGRVKKTESPLAKYDIS